MKTMLGQVEGIIVAKYSKGKFTWTCKKANDFYCATFHNGRQSARTYFSKDANEINDLIKAEMKNGFRRIV